MRVKTAVTKAATPAAKKRRRGQYPAVDGESLRHEIGHCDQIVQSAQIDLKFVDEFV